MKNLTAVFEEAKEGGYICWFEEIPEAMSQGETRKQAKKNLQCNALKLVLEYRHEQSKDKLRKLRARYSCNRVTHKPGLLRFARNDGL